MATAVSSKSIIEQKRPNASAADFFAKQRDQELPEVALTENSALPRVAFLDDSPLARWVWEAKLKTKTRVITFASPSDFWKAVKNDTLELGSLHTIVTDHYFAPEEKVTGVEFANQLRKQSFAGRILLASNGEFDPGKLTGIVDKIVDKQPTDWDVLNS